MPSLHNHIQTLVGENSPNLTLVLNAFANQTLPKKHLLLQELQVCKYLYFIESGALQLFLINDKGEEKTLDILLAGDWFTDLPSFKTQTPSYLNARTIQACQLQKISFDAFEKLLAAAPKFMEGYLKIIEHKYQQMQSRLQAFQVLKSAERIQWLLTNKPQILKDCPDKIVASYLGITKETYCRQKSVLI